MELTEQEFLNLASPDNFKPTWQTLLHGIWVDGYMFNNHQTIRKIYREIN